VTDGVNGDLIQGQDSDPTTGTPIWHTAQESFARVEYSAGSGTHTDDSWDAWDKDGTQYVFDLNALITDDSHSIRVTNRWMLHTATDVHGNVITYSYAYEDGAGALHYSPIVTGTTAAVYPYQITYGSGGDKIQVTFEIVSRTINSATDATLRDRTSGVSQSYRIDKISVQRRQASTSSLALLRAYTLTQDYSTVLTPTTGLTTSVTGYVHLTLTGINPKGNDGTTALPSTTFDYIQGATPCCPLYPEQDYGHLWHAYNGYGGQVGFYYDAAGAEVNQAYRRVRAKRVVDGLGYDAIHDVPYFYDYRGATLNTVYKSDEAADPYALHTAKNEFRGFAFVREQDPMGQVTDHYYSQDDVFKAQEWRVQAGKTVSFTDSMDAVPPGAAWSAVGTVSGGIDPNPPTPTATPTPPANRYWSMMGVGAALGRSAGVNDGADVSIRFRIQGAGATPTAQPFAGTWKLENANGNGEYWGLQIYSSGDRTNGYTLEPKVIWGKQVNGTLQQGSRDLAPTAAYRPTRAVDLAANQWYRLQLHTSPDGRFAIELYRDDTQGEYVQIKASDLDDNGQPIPALPPGQIWRFQQAITQDGNNTWSAWADDYSESRTVYTQVDTVQTSLPATAATARDFTKLYAGEGNNCGSMAIRFVAATEQWNAIFGADTQLGQTKRTKKTYAYDSYGNQTSQVEYGDLAQAGDERNTQSSYVVSTAPYIVSKPAWTKTYSSTTTTTELAETHYYYDNQVSYGIIPTNGHGDLTKVEQIGVLNGTLTGQSSTQQFQYDSYGNQTRVTDPDGNPTNTTFDSYYASFPIQVGHANGRNETMDYDYTLDVVTRTVDMNGTVTQRRYDVFGRPAKTWIEGFGTQTTPNESYQFADSGQSKVPAPFYISYSRLLTGTQSTWQTRWLDGLGRPVQDVSPKDATTSIVVDTTYTTTGVISSTTVPYLAPNNNPLTHVTPDPTQAITTHYYDGLRRPTQVVNPDNTAVTYDYSLLQWVGTQDESGHQKWQRTDMLGRTDLIEEVDNTGYDPNL
jgi:YD repeat-containing protein